MPYIETIVGWLCSWAVGLFVSLGIGHLVTELFVERLRKWMGFPEPKPRSPPLNPSEREVPRWLTGLIERLLFTILVGVEAEGVLTAMMAWLALKMATNWNFSAENYPRPLAWSALLAGIVSMLFAFLGGMTRRCLSNLC